jgi:multicomponent Na+:H+ antiporter subunit G
VTNDVVEVVAGFLIGLGVALMMLAAVGILRLPDVFSRTHAATKSASLGLGCILAGTALILPDRISELKLVLAILFQFFTAPVAAHMIGRAAYRSGTPLWEGTLFDELEKAIEEGP